MRRSRRSSGVRIELAPFVDVVLVLLIFFVVATSLSMQQKGLQIQLPSAASGVTTKKGVVLNVDATQHIFLNERFVAAESLSSEISHLVSVDPHTQVIIHADESVPYRFVVEVLDGVRLGGCFDVVLEAQKKPIPH